jgi:hypothetical protein
VKWSRRMEVERGIGVGDASHNMLPCPAHGGRSGGA